MQFIIILIDINFIYALYSITIKNYVNDLQLIPENLLGIESY